MLPVLLLIISTGISSITCEFKCVGTCYSGRTFPMPEDIVHGKHLKGYSYKNITTDDPQKCYSSCVNDCRCKACQMKDSRCELVDSDNKNLVAESGYVYYEVKQEFYKGKSHMVQPGVCLNGCCRSQPCLNGGTCVEHCDTPKEKFFCKCTQPFAGSVCEKNVSSCMDHLKRAHGASPTNGKYTIFRTDNNLPIEVFCDFNSTNQAWTLIESFKAGNHKQYEDKAFHSDYERNPNLVPNWDDYRLSLSNMKYLRTKSTMFRATCDFPNRGGVLIPDYLFGYLSEYDIINHGDVDGDCFKFAHISVKQLQYFNEPAGTFHKIGQYHLHLEPNTKCGFKDNTAKAVEEYFGLYTPVYDTTKCTTTSLSTTQWWLGEQK